MVDEMLMAELVQYDLVRRVERMLFKNITNELTISRDFLEVMYTGIIFFFISIHPCVSQFYC